MPLFVSSQTTIRWCNGIFLTKNALFCHNSCLWRHKQRRFLPPFEIITSIALPKLIVAEVTEIVEDDVIHNEYDILTKSGKYIEIKTARKGRTGNTFQFNGINPRYNYDYLVCLGICEDKLLYRLFLKSETQYIHKERNHFIIQGDYKRQLVQMNPDNHVNFKLTIKIDDLFDISNLVDELKELLS